MESIRSCFFNGVDIHSKKLSWVRWKNVMASKDKGGLRVSSLFALNQALMFKWVWRFISQSSSLWAMVIKALHGEDGKICKKVKSTYPSIWLNIIHEVELLKLQGIGLLSFVHSKFENVEESPKKTQAEVTEGSSKRTGQKLEQESAKKQKLAEQEQAKVANDDTAELKRCLEIVPEDDDDVAIEATPLSSKSPTIVDYKIYREGKKSYFKIIRADGNSQTSLTFRTMFKNFNKEDLEVLKGIVKERFKNTKPVDDMKNLLFQTLKTMFEPHVEYII
nr:RNA-directed DNA polymerase, eukaryota, reverse transcriptase zinc-binding domain protein [Tanacetum cinerariifolium]